jgi:MFS family permease
MTLKLPKSANLPDLPVVDERIALFKSRLRRMLAVVLSLPAFMLSLVHFLQMMGLGIIMTAAPLMTAQALGWNANEIALALALGGALAAILSPWLGSLSDRLGRTRVMAGGLLFMAAEGLVLFLHPGTVATMAALAIGGGSAPAYYNALYSLQGDATSPRERGALTGFVGSFGEWGSIIGSSVITPLVWRAISVSAPMAVDAALLAAAFFLALAMKPVIESGTEWASKAQHRE